MNIRHTNALQNAFTQKRRLYIDWLHWVIIEILLVVSFFGISSHSRSKKPGQIGILLDRHM